MASEKSKVKSIKSRFLLLTHDFPLLIVFYNGGRSSAVRASDCGSEGRGFKSPRPPQKKKVKSEKSEVKSERLYILLLTTDF